jgi:hypothetical protein
MDAQQQETAPADQQTSENTLIQIIRNATEKY